jgi:hypothetical protein
MRMAIAILAVCFCSTLHAQECTPPSDQYFGTMLPDGKCHVLDKSTAQFFDRKNDCTPDLEGRGIMMLVPRKCVIPGRDQLVSGCTPPADQYIGVLQVDGSCLPWRKDQQKLISGPYCTPELKAGHLEFSFPKIVNGFFDETMECVPDELRVRPSPPTQPSLLDLQRNIDELKDEIEQLKRERQ